MHNIAKALEQLAQSGNLRVVPSLNAVDNQIDLSSNDYLGIASDRRFVENFFSRLTRDQLQPASSASRLLASRQEEYFELEKTLSTAYGRETLLFNSGYHANTGLIKALASKSTLFIADKLVHASIIDGLHLAAAAGATFVRFRHNDMVHLRRIMETQAPKFERIVIVAESVYSMDGDCADISALVQCKQLYPNVLIYLDEAHAVGVLGPHGLGLAFGHENYDDIDIVVGTFGKALASMGAFAAVSPTLREYFVNTARSFIFSTALPPLTMRWSLATFQRAYNDDEARKNLAELGKTLQTIIKSPVAGHIQPLLVGNPKRAVELSQKLADNGYRVLPIRTPTVPPGTDRLRFSLSANLSRTDLLALGNFLETYSETSSPIINPD